MAFIKMDKKSFNNNWEETMKNSDPLVSGCGPVDEVTENFLWLCQPHKPSKNRSL